ncbi:unnamed protein product [Caretta caretta]
MIAPADKMLPLPSHRENCSGPGKRGQGHAGFGGDPAICQPLGLAGGAGPQKGQVDPVLCELSESFNAITVSDAYPMPRPDELLHKLGGARYLTTMDLTKGYWQVPLDADARLKSAFITPLGLYEFLTLPFCLKGAPATFQHLVDQLLRGMERFAVAYIDDICVFSQTWEDHVSQVRQVLD